MNPFILLLGGPADGRRVEPHTAPGSTPTPVVRVPVEGLDYWEYVLHGLADSNGSSAWVYVSRDIDPNKTPILQLLMKRYPQSPTPNPRPSPPAVPGTGYQPCATKGRPPKPPGED